MEQVVSGRCRVRPSAMARAVLLLALVAAAAVPQPPDRRRSHDFGLEGVAAAQQVTAEVHRRGFVWPQLPEGTDTVFAALEIRARRGQPRLEVSAGTLRFHQYFERGAYGRRYLNLSPLARAGVEAGSQITLAGRGLRWQSGRVPLFAFDNSALTAARVLVVAPHPFLDAHWDHQFTTVALIEALERVPELGPALLLYTNHPITREIYPFGPRDGMASLLPWFGEELELESLYSHPLSEEQQRRKLIALEAMHDLRRFELGRRTTWGRHFKQLIAATGRSLTPGKPPDYSYFRRAGRPNEIFFVLSVEAARAMKERFLVDCGARLPCRSETEPSTP